MALNEYIISGVPGDAQTSNFTLNGMGNRAQPDIPGLSADEMKDVMDELVTKVIAPAMNGALTEAYNNFVTLADFLVPARHVVADDVTDPGVTNTDIPSVKALNKAIDDAVIAAGAADMTKAEYASGQATGVVSHAALADTATTATNATNAANATNATQLNGQSSSYYATSSSVTTLSNTLSTRKVNGHALSEDVTVTKSDVGLGNVDNAQQMPIAGGTFTGAAYAFGTNTSTSRLRNIVVQNSSGTAQSTNYLICRRK